MTGDLIINGIDAYADWGISLDPNSLSALMTPAPNKPFISNKYRKMHGKKVIRNNARKDERSFTLTLVMTAKTEGAFLSQYAGFCEQLATGWMEISTRYIPNVVFRCEYLSCVQFSQFARGIAKYSLKLNEPDPDNRGEQDKYEDEDE